jgi:hypothetical protein
VPVAGARASWPGPALRAHPCASGYRDDRSGPGGDSQLHRWPPPRMRACGTVPERFAGWKTAGVPLAADDLGAWLVGLLADAGRRKLTKLVLGDDQESALRSAATAAIQRTAEELDADDDEQAGHVALVISQVFSEPASGARLAGQATVLEALQAGIVGQLAVLDDASLTGTEQSAADVLAVTGTALAEKLTTHLLREIAARGSRGGRACGQQRTLPLWWQRRGHGLPSDAQPGCEQAEVLARAPC